MNKRGTILIENVIFIILNVVFLSMIILFLTNQTSNAQILNELYAKKIAFVADYGKPDMIIKMDMTKGMKIAEKNNADFSDVVSITGNVVNVNLKAGSDETGYSYSFFNDVLVCSYPDRNSDTEEFTGLYVFTITKNSEGSSCQN